VSAAYCHHSNLPPLRRYCGTGKPSDRISGPSIVAEVPVADEAQADDQIDRGILVLSLNRILAMATIASMWRIPLSPSIVIRTSDDHLPEGDQPIPVALKVPRGNQLREGLLLLDPH